MDQEYTQRLKKIETVLEQWLPQEPNSDWAETVFGTIGKKISTEAQKMLLAPPRELTFRGGKRWRPLLMSLVCETLGGGDNAIPLSPITELAHNASLIHDDIEDGSDERRGKPSIHKMFGEDIAINSGSFLYFLALSCLENSQINNKELILKKWAECIRRLHLGQSLDINWHREITFVPEIDDYYTMCALKTGSLARLAVELGAIAAGAPQEVIKLLGEAADSMGIGFQILDDVKNLTTGVYGKKRGDDIVEGKKSLPILLFLNKYPDKKNQVFYYFSEAKMSGSTAPEVEDMIDLLSNSVVFAEAEEKAKSFLKETKDIFNSDEFASFAINEDGRKLLEGFLKIIS
ncbi:MAG: polyprenyl synthetase family protein [Treponema sp.]|nr:polyprenyl synthetase family protein [Treponema sp.]MCL2250880.1 polyprenyl synthetase family protein [Treponema sp.]